MSASTREIVLNIPSEPDYIDPIRKSRTFLIEWIIPAIFNASEKEIEDMLDSSGINPVILLAASNIICSENWGGPHGKALSHAYSILPYIVWGHFSVEDGKNDRLL